MSDREKIFARIRSANAALPERAQLPDWDPLLPISCQSGGDPLATFQRELEAVHGRYLPNEKALVELLKSESILRAYRDPKILDRLDWSALESVVTWQDHYGEADLETVMASVTLAAGVIAETGTVILRSRDSASRLAALGPWIHIAVCPPDRVYGTVEEALAAMGDDPYLVWATGPSKTADIEGILIEGVHGPGFQAVMIQ